MLKKNECKAYARLERNLLNATEQDLSTNWMSKFEDYLVLLIYFISRTLSSEPLVINLLNVKETGLLLLPMAYSKDQRVHHFNSIPGSTAT